MLYFFMQDVRDEKLELTGNQLSFKGKAGPEAVDYALELPFFADIDKEASKVSVMPRQVCALLASSTHTKKQCSLAWTPSHGMCLLT